MYWIWKNYSFEEGDIVGFAHYNKVLDIKPVKAEKLLTTGDFEWIARDFVEMPKHTYEHDVKILEEVLKEYYHEYYSVWQELFDSTGKSKSQNCANCEMFYTTVDEFEKYCEFLFGVLFKVYDRIGEVDREPYHKRYCAFLGERLLSVYLVKNNRIVYNCQIRPKRNVFISYLRSIYLNIGLNKNPKIKKMIMVLKKDNKRCSQYLK